MFNIMLHGAAYLAYRINKLHKTADNATDWALNLSPLVFLFTIPTIELLDTALCAHRVHNYLYLLPKEPSGYYIGLFDITIVILLCFVNYRYLSRNQKAIYQIIDQIKDTPLYKRKVYSLLMWCFFICVFAYFGFGIISCTEHSQT